MRLISLEFESRLREKGLWPQTWVAWAALYALALDLLLVAVQGLSRGISPATAASLGGWVTFLSGLAIVLLAIAGYRWLRAKLLWRLRNRLIVTYVFIGVIPVLLLVMISLLTLYLFAGQFASFVVTSEIASRLRSMESSNRAIAHHLANRLQRGETFNADAVGGIRPQHREWARRQVCVWYGNQAQPNCTGPKGAEAFSIPAFVDDSFREIVRDHGALYLRTATVIGAEPESLRVISSEPLDKVLLQEIAVELGEVTLWQPNPSATIPGGKIQPGILISSGEMVSEDGRQFEPTFTAGSVPAASSVVDREVVLGAQLLIVDWASAKGDRQRTGAFSVRTRPSVLYTRLFAALGNYVQVLEFALLIIAIVFGIIELLALVIGTKLTRSITSAVGQLYEGTQHVNRGDFSHRIKVQSTDQLATLANSFNSMTTSIEKLVQEQKEKQRLESELAIAQEVQVQLYPKLITQLESLEVHGFCRPARTVSGDYYDFLGLNSDKLMLAVGDISGKGISAALMMATIHSAVRAYSIEDIAMLREPVEIAVAGLMLASEAREREVSPAALLTLLNHQLYESTPAAKYATLFLGLYDGATRRLTYSNGGHLPPIVISEDGSSRLLDCGGTVVGLFDNPSFPEATVELRSGDLLVAYSDGVTEPENDYGEFGEERLIQLVCSNRHLPLERITEIVTAAVEDWIGDNEQPDDVTLVLARAK
jgi:phosphoserine phosphatase RsbU/P